MLPAPRRLAAAQAALVLLALAPAALAAEPVVTVLADFEEQSVAVTIGDVQNIPYFDCTLAYSSLPARGQYSLSVTLGATRANAAANVDLLFREATRFAQAERAATYAWIDEGDATIAFRVRDRDGRLFESPPQPVSVTRRWVRLSADLTPGALRRVRGEGDLAWPIEITGYRVATSRLGKQVVFVDELQVEHRVERVDMIRGGFLFNEPTRIYEPRATVATAIVLENRSRQTALALQVELVWQRSDGVTSAPQRASINLPASGAEFRSWQRLDFTQRVDQPGLYRLTARVRAAGWSAPNSFETTIAVTPSNRRLPRGRSTFFSVRSNLFRESPLDRWLEIELAGDIGVNLLAFDLPWRQLETRAGVIDFPPLDAVVERLAAKDVAAMALVVDPPEAVSRDDAVARVAALVRALHARYGDKLRRYQLSSAALRVDSSAAGLGATAKVRTALGDLAERVELLPPAFEISADASVADLRAHLELADGKPTLFTTRGDALSALRLVRRLRTADELRWPASAWWLHEAAGAPGPGTARDAEQLLHYYLEAAAAGVSGLIWFDLRDDDAEASVGAVSNGLVRRDFSPRAALLGFASAAGMLTGQRYAGPLFGTPDECESALFISGERQTAVLLTRPNRVPPAVFAPVRGVEGDLRACDFDRTPRELLSPARQPLLPAQALPQYVVFSAATRQPEPQVALARPWVRAPQIVFARAGGAPFEVDLPPGAKDAYATLRVPTGVPLTIEPGNIVLRADAGPSVRESFTLSPAAGKPFERAAASLTVSIDADRVELPLEVRRIHPLAAEIPGAPATDPRYRLGAAAPDGEQAASADVVLFARWRPEALVLTVECRDDRYTPPGHGSGDELRLGLARAGQEDTIRLRLPLADSQARPTRLDDGAEAPTTWKLTRTGGEKGAPLILELTIPQSALGGPLQPDSRLLLAMRYLDDDEDGFGRMNLSWGGEAEGGRSTHEFNWVELARGAR